jgi:hypothetical protein
MKTTTLTSNGEILQRAIADRQPVRKTALNNASPWHRPLTDNTQRVCDHVDMFQPERWKQRSNWAIKPTKESAANNAVMNRLNRKMMRLLNAGKMVELNRFMIAHPECIRK